MKTPLLLLAAFASVTALHAADPVLKADFSSAALPEGWSSVKGEWKVTDGALVGTELPTDKHAAVFSIPDPHANSTLRLRIRLDGAKGFHLSYNHAKGHLFRVSIANGEAILRMDKDKKDPASKGEVLAKKAVVLKPGEWADLTCTVEGTKVLVTIGEVTLEGTHADLAKEKTGYRFVVAGESIAFDDVAFVSGK